MGAEIVVAYALLIIIIAVIHTTGLTKKLMKITGMEGVSKVALLVRITIGIASILITMYAVLYKTELIMKTNYIIPAVYKTIGVLLSIFVAVALEAGLMFTERSIFEAIKKGLNWVALYTALYAGLTYTNYKTFIWAANVAAEQAMERYEKRDITKVEVNKVLITDAKKNKDFWEKRVKEIRNEEIDYRAYLHSNYAKMEAKIKTIKNKIGKKNWSLIEKGNQWTINHFKKELNIYEELKKRLEIEKAKAIEKAKRYKEAKLSKAIKKYEEAVEKYDKENKKKENKLKELKETQIKEATNIKEEIERVANIMIIVNIITALFIALESGNMARVMELIRDEMTNTIELEGKREELYKKKQEIEENMKAAQKAQKSGSTEEELIPIGMETEPDREDIETPTEILEETIDTKNIVEPEVNVDEKRNTKKTIGEKIQRARENQMTIEEKKEKIFELMKHAIETDMEYEDNGKTKKLVNWAKLYGNKPQEAFAITPLHKALKQYYGEDFKIGKTNRKGHIPHIRDELQTDLEKYLEHRNENNGKTHTEDV